MIAGTITFSGIGDPELDIIVRVKEQHEQSLHFNPQQIQCGFFQPTPPPPMFSRPGFQPPPQPVPPQAPPGQVYNNVVLSWSDEDGMNAVVEILHRIAPAAPSGPFPPLPERT